VFVPLSGEAGDLSSLVTLELSGCAQVSSDEVDRILGLELRSIAAGHHDLTARPIRVTATCAPGILSLEARDNATARFSRRLIQTDVHPREGMERIIAIATAELALSTWEQFSADAADTPSSSKNEDGPVDFPPSAAKAKEKKRAPAGKNPESRLRTRDKGQLSASVQLSALWRMYLSSKTSLFGGEIGGNLGIPPLFRMHLGIAPEGGRTDRTLGDASLFSLSAAYFFGMHGRLFSSPLQGGVDIGFYGGYGRLSGRPQSPPTRGDTLSGGFGGPLLHLSLASATRPAAGLSAEIGYAVFGITGRVDVGGPVTIKGLWISVRLDCLLSRTRGSDR
jgi:hypothetical protein